MGQSPAKATANKKWAFSERKARESRNLYLLLGFGSAAAAFAAAATALGAAAPFCSWLEVSAQFSSKRVDSRWIGLGSQHRDRQASPLDGCARTDPLPARLRLLPRPCSPRRVALRSGGLGGTSSSSSFCSLRWRFFGPRFIAQVLRLQNVLAREGIGGRAPGDGREGPRQVHTGAWGGA